MTTIITKNSSTASAAPVAGDLTKGELAVNVTDKKLYTKDNGGSVVKLVGSLGNQEASAVAITGGAIDGTSIGGTTASTASFTTVSASGNVTLSGGTANGVLYLNGSKVATSGSALTFDGTNLNLGVNGATIYWTAAGNNVAINTSSGVLGFYTGTSSYGLVQQINADGTTFWKVGGSEAMRVTSTGLGIGTSSPATKLHVDTGAAGYAITVAANLQTSRKYQFGIDSNSNLAIYETAAASQFLVLNTSGNLGLGVTPSAWVTTGSSRGMQFGRAGSIFYSTDQALATFGNNNYQDGATTFKYLTTGYAQRYAQSDFDGAHKWFNAPSGTAGDAITFTQAMTLDASGNLLVGTTSAMVSAAGRGNITINGSGSSILSLGIAGSNSGYLYSDANGIELSSIGNTYVRFSTNGSERARIDSSGNLLVGTTSQPAGSYRFVANTNGTGANGGAFFVSDQATTVNEAFSAWHTATSGNNTFCYFGTEATFTVRGSITYNRAGGLTAYNVTSDYRAKDIIGPVLDSGALIDSVPVYMGKMHGATQERPMFIAHETPAYAHTGEKDAVDADGNPVYQQMDASALIPVMWAEIQSLRKRLADAGIA